MAANCPLEITCSLVTVDGGPAMAVAVRDGSHREDTDSGRRLAVSLLDATLETTADGIVVVSNDGLITGVNDQYLKLWGMPPELIAAEDPTALVTFISRQLADPDYFLQKVAELLRRQGQAEPRRAGVQGRPQRGARTPGRRRSRT